ncbi:hypothetical protein [Microbispora sp. NPDC049125]|uniref:hypothetical protein n=1 Tax=Microbispora sp. NPDC049125 TaxID=3154929 RepID=UPI0034677084
MSSVLLIGGLALGLTGSVTTAADASGPLPKDRGPSTVVACQAPGPGTPAHRFKTSIKVKGRKVFKNGKLVATIPPGEKVIVVDKNGKIYVGKKAEGMMGGSKPGVKGRLIGAHKCGASKCEDDKRTFGPKGIEDPSARDARPVHPEVTHSKGRDGRGEGAGMPGCGDPECEDFKVTDGPKPVPPKVTDSKGGGSAAKGEKGLKCTGEAGVDVKLD